MRLSRIGIRIVLMVVICCGALVACSTRAPQIDLLTQPEPGTSRQRAMLRLNLASAYYEQNQTDVAQQEVRAALKIDSEFADAYSLLGLIHQRNNAPELAQQSFEHALDLATQASMRSADVAEIQHNYGWFLCQQNRFVEAQIQFDRAVSQTSYRQINKTRNAIGYCQQRASLEPKLHDGKTELHN